MAFLLASALPASGFVDDNTPTSLIGFSLDMNLGLLHLTFNDIIDADTFYARALTIQNADVSNEQDIVELTLSSFTDSDDGYFITVNISAPDLNAIKLNDNLGLRLTIPTYQCKPKPSMITMVEMFLQLLHLKQDRLITSLQIQPRSVGII